MAKVEDALIGGDEIDDRLHAARKSFPIEQRGDLVLRHAGTHGADGRIHRLGAQLLNAR